MAQKMSNMLQIILSAGVVAVGIPNMRLTERRGKTYFVPHTSTSRDKNVADGFIGKGGGTLVEIHRDDGLHGGKGVSWVTNFPAEHETLFFGGTLDYAVENVEIEGAGENVEIDGAGENVVFDAAEKYFGLEKYLKTSDVRFAIRKFRCDLCQFVSNCVNSRRIA